MKTHFARTGLAALCWGLAASLAPAVASAAIVTGSWDPALPNPPFVDLGWTATFNIQVGGGCELGAVARPYTVGIAGRSFGCSTDPQADPSPFSVLSAQVGLYDLNSRTIVDVLTFSPDYYEVALVTPPPGQATTYLLTLTADLPEQGGIPRTDDFVFLLDLPGATPTLAYQQVDTTFDFTTAPGQVVEIGFEVNDDAGKDRVLEASRLRVGQQVGHTVPEPGALPLVALALGGLAAARVRRRGG